MYAPRMRSPFLAASLWGVVFAASACSSGGGAAGDATALDAAGSDVAASGGQDALTADAQSGLDALAGDALSGIDASTPPDASPTDDAGLCAPSNADCSAGQTCCQPLSCDSTTKICVQPPCRRRQADCTLVNCCAGLACDPVTYLCR
jgi:hypothetical protein